MVTAVMETPMELFGVVSTAVPFLLLKTPAAVYAQQEQQDLAKLRQQSSLNLDNRKKPAGPQDAKPAQEDASKPGDRKAVTAPRKRKTATLTSPYWTSIARFGGN
jgi:hypothetical protein